jgi:DNA-binding transcriptional MerR regulator
MDEQRPIQPSEAEVLTTPQLQEAVSRLERTAPPSNAILHAWIKSGLIQPRFDRTAGRAALWSLDDLAVIRLILRLRNAGISGQRVRLILSQIGPDLPNLLKSDRQEKLLIVDGYRAVLRTVGSADRELPSGQLRLPLASIVEDNDKVAAAIRAA